MPVPPPSKAASPQQTFLGNSGFPNRMSGRRWQPKSDSGRPLFTFGTWLLTTVDCRLDQVVCRLAAIADELRLKRPRDHPAAMIDQDRIEHDEATPAQHLTSDVSLRCIKCRKGPH